MIGSSAPAWAVWLALGLWGLAGVVGAVAFVMARKYLRQLKPMLVPLLSMLAPPRLTEPTDEELLQAIVGEADVGEPDCGIDHEHDSQCFPGLRA